VKRLALVCTLALAQVIPALSAPTPAAAAATAKPAKKAAKKANKKAAKKAKKYFKKANKNLKKKKWDKAIALYLKALEIAPTVGAVHVNLARAYKGGSKCGPSLLHFQAYLALKPNAKDRSAINAERKECVVKIGDVARLTVEVLTPDEDDDDEDLAPMPTGDAKPADGSDVVAEMTEQDDEPEPPDPTIMAVSLNGVPVGDTPMSGLILGPGAYLVVVSREGMAPQEHPVSLKASEGTELLLDIEGRLAPGRLSFVVKPDGALVQFDGKPIGAAPDLEARTLAAGPYKVKIIDPNGGHLPWSGTIHVNAGQEEELSITLERKTGVIVVRAPPGAAVLVNREPQRAGRPIEVPEGTYEVRVMMAGRKPWVRQVKVPLGNTIELIANPEGDDGPSAPMDMWTLGAIGAGGTGLLAAIGGGVVGAIARSQYSDVEDRIALDDQGGYATPSEIDEIDGKQLTANLLFGVALLGAVGAAVLWFHEDLGLGGSAGSTPAEAQPSEASDAGETDDPGDDPIDPSEGEPAPAQ